MTNQEKVRHIFRKYPETKFNRSEFWWKYFCEFHGATIYIMENQWKEAYKNFQAVDRALRDILKEKEFQLPPEADSKRYEKTSLFKNNAKKNN